MGRWAVISGVFGLLLLGCGEADESKQGEVPISPPISAPEGKRRPNMPPARPSAGGFTGKFAKRYREDRIVCGVFPASQVAQEFGLSPDASMLQIAEAYADGFYGQFEQAAFEGCFAGLHP